MATIMTTSVSFGLSLFFFLLLSAISAVSISSSRVVVEWHNVTHSIKSVPTLQVVANPLLSRASPVHDASFQSLSELNARHVRYAAWFPYPRMTVPALDGPSGPLQCRDVGIGSPAHFSCESVNGVISEVQTGTFGLHEGRCGAFVPLSKCSSPNASLIIDSLCKNRTKCSVPSSPDLFGSPCPDRAGEYRLAVQIVCSPPERNHTYWNFTFVDEMVVDFMEAAGEGGPVISFSTLPSWLFNQSNLAVHHPPDLLQGLDWGYNTGTALLDPTCREVGQYYARLLSWYINGNFTDEGGVLHQSSRRYPFKLIEILNEELHEHSIDIKEYVCIFDAIVFETRRLIDPQHELKFVGMAYANIDVALYDNFAYFLNASNHLHGIIPDWLSYHWYSQPPSRTNVTVFETFFSDNLIFQGMVERIEKLRMQLSPLTRVTIDEIGVTLPDDNSVNAEAIPPLYFNAAAGAFAHLFCTLAPMGIDVLGSSQLMGNPYLPDVLGGTLPQFSSVTLLNWTSGLGTARYHVLQMMIDHFTISDNITVSAVSTVQKENLSMSVYAQGFIRTDHLVQQLFVLLVNMRSTSQVVLIPEATGSLMQIVDEATGNNPPRVVKLSSDNIELAPFAVAFVRITNSHFYLHASKPSVQST